MNATELRNLVKTMYGRDLSTEQAEQFLKIFAADLTDDLNIAKRHFVRRHFQVSR